MADFQLGEKVRVGFNPPHPDLRVPNQVNGMAPGRGEYQTEALSGVILAALADDKYMVEVELKSVGVRNGREIVNVSHRKRIVSAEKLEKS